MSKIFGNGVQRHINATSRQFTSCIFQPGKAPISEEVNLVTDINTEARRLLMSSQVPSGWIMNLEDPHSDFEFHPRASNLFWLGKSSAENVNQIPTALVNGWVIPVAGTLSSDLRNAIKLPPPQGSTNSTDVNFVFLEVWTAQLSPLGSVNKPAEDQIYRFGNVEFGAGNLTSQILDPRYKIETAERHQLQYRIRVVPTVNPENSPYGFNSAIKAQGPLDTEVSSTNASYQFQNMGTELGDPGLWRAGVANTISSDGLNVLTQSELPTVDGYVYAIPLAFVFRRSTEAWSISQQAAGVNRNPDMSDRSEAAMLTEVSLTQEVLPTSTSIEVSVSRTSTTFPETDGLIRIGREIIAYDSWVNTTITTTLAGRGAKDTQVSRHEVGAEVTHVTGHPLNLFSDQIVEADVYDLRHAVNPSGMDYTSILQRSFMSLSQNRLRTQWKTSQGGVKGTRHFQADYFSQQAPPANYVIERDGPDNFRKIFSDACVLQPDNLIVVEGTTVDSATYTFNVQNTQVYHVNTAWESGDSVRIPLNPLQDSYKTSDNQKVRFVHPSEYQGKKHNPVRVGFANRTQEDLVVSDLESGASRTLAVFGKTPDDVGSLFTVGLSSNLTFDGDTIAFATGGGGTIDFSSPGPSGGTLADHLASINAYVIIEQNSGTAPYKGAFRILGSGATTGLQVEDAQGNAAAFGTSSLETCDWRIRLEECTEEDEDLIVVLVGGPYPSETLYLNFDVLYHPNQGLGRVPEIPLFTELEPGGSTAYVRENTFPNVASSVTQNVKRFPTAPFMSVPVDRSQPRFRSLDARQSIEDTWAESYVDRGSKTILFQPLRQAQLSVSPDTVVNAQDAVTAYASPGSNTGLDFQLADGDDCIFIPSSVLPPCGRQDLPFVRGTGGQVPSGINFLFPVLDGAGRVNENLTQNRVLGIYDPTNTALPGDYNTFVNLTSVSTGGPSESALVCRLYDRGGVRGLELPAHFGVARLFGVYVRSDYYTNGSEYTVGSNYRVRKTTYAGQNLLRQDVTRRSLIITEENTFVIPEDVIDLEILDADISTAELVFEFGAFMFNDWKAEKVQFHTISGTSTVVGSIPVLLNGPAASVDTFTQISTRIPYQGNVNGTMPVSTSDVASVSYSDYTIKSQADRNTTLQNLATPLDSRDARVQNPAKLEVLAHIPFLTSMGTGRVSGQYQEGAYTDVGYVSQEGFPFSLSGEIRDGKTRALEASEGEVISDELNGFSERLPAGILSSDHLMMGEALLSGSGRFQMHVGIEDTGHYADYRNNVPFSKPFGQGTLVFSDGTSGGNLSGVTYNASADLYRTYRGGVVASATMPNPGGSILMGTEKVFKKHPGLRDFGQDYAYLIEQNRQGMISATELNVEINRLIDLHRQRYQIHGGVIFGVAMLVRTHKEVVTTSEIEANYGGELQMLVLTGTSFGKDQDLQPLTGQNKEVISPVIQLQPAGTGEGYCAADRYRVQGRPLRLESKNSSSLDFEIDRGSQPAEDVDPLCP